VLRISPWLLGAPPRPASASAAAMVMAMGAAARGVGGSSWPLVFGPLVYEKIGFFGYWQAKNLR